MSAERWEYKTFNYNETAFLTGRLNMEQLEGKLNELGREGWEVASAAGQAARFGRGSYGLIVVLKRQR